MPDPPDRRCSSCWWWSTHPGDTTGYCYEKDIVSTPAEHVCDEWDAKPPETLRPKKA